MRRHLERARTAADEESGWRSPWSGSTAREGVWSNVRSAEVMLLRPETAVRLVRAVMPASSASSQARAWYRSLKRVDSARVPRSGSAAACSAA